MCDYTTYKISDLKKHLETEKHKKIENETFETKSEQNVSNSLQCVCGICFNSRTTLWRHKKVCNLENKFDEVEKKSLNDKEVIIMLVKQNTELMAMLKNNNSNHITHNTNSNNTNSNNKTFNLQFFLNETCKDAMNIMDFVDSIKLQLTDLEKVGQIGYVEGISNIINANLKALDVTQRPIHCTDKKRETLYIKDEDKWEKENEDKSKIRKAIKQISHKNSKMIPMFKDVHPDCNKSVSKYSDQYNKIIIEAMGGPGDNDNEKEDKIIKNITKEVTIEK